MSFLKDLLSFLLHLIQWPWRTRYLRERRWDIESLYRQEIQAFEADLTEAETDEERSRIREKLRNLREEQIKFYRGTREELLSEITGMRDYDRSLKRHPDDAATLAKRGAALALMSRYEEALADFNRSLELRPDDPDTLYNRGVVLSTLQRYEEALADYTRLLELRPAYPKALYNRGTTLYGLKRYQEALADFNRSLELRPDDPDTLGNRGVALRALQRRDEALADFNRALELRPDHAINLFLRGFTLTDLKRYEEALADFNRSLDLRPNDPPTLYTRARLYSLTGRLPDSWKQLKEAISRDAKYRKMAREDEDFANLRSDPQLGREFERLVAEPED